MDDETHDDSAPPGDIAQLPWGAIGGTIAGWFVTLALGYFLFVLPSFDEQTRTVLSGTVTHVRTPKLSGKLELDLALAEHTVRFRVPGPIFFGGMNRVVPTELQPGAFVALTVSADDLASPHRPAPYRLPTVSAQAIHLDGRDVLPLAASRRWHNGNRFLAKASFPIFLLLTLTITGHTWVECRERRRRAASSDTA